MIPTDDRLRVESGLDKLHDLEEVILDCLETLERRRTALLSARGLATATPSCGTVDAKLIRRTAELIRRAQEGRRTLSGLATECRLDPDCDSQWWTEAATRLSDCRVRLQTYLLALVTSAKVFGEMSLERSLEILGRAQDETSSDPSTERLRERAASLLRHEHVLRTSKAGG